MTKKEENLQEKYMELQMLSMQMKQFQQQLEQIEHQCVELENAQDILATLSDTQPGSSFVTVTPGVLAKGKLEKSDTVIVNVGSGIFVEKPTKQTCDDVGTQVAELRHVQQELNTQLEALASKAMKVEKELQGLVK